MPRRETYPAHRGTFVFNLQPVGREAVARACEASATSCFLPMTGVDRADPRDYTGVCGHVTHGVCAPSWHMAWRAGLDAHTYAKRECSCWADENVGSFEWGCM
jgi:hypothetical protein